MPTSLPRVIVLVAAMVALLAGLAAPGAAADKEPDPMLKERMHRYQDYHILVIKGRNPSEGIRRLVTAPAAYKIVVWQALPEDTHPADVAALLEWVHHGGVLWFHDSRLAPWFGLEAAPVGRADLKAFKAVTPEYGALKKLAGGATFGQAPPATRHVLLSGVDAVQIFVIETGPDQYSALRDGPGMVALLKVDVVTGAPCSDRVLAGLVACGKGTIVFKPLIWTDQLTGERFQDNLLEWSAGFGVPDIAGTNGGYSRGNVTPGAERNRGPGNAGPAGQATDRIIMNDHRILEGTILTPVVALTTIDTEIRTESLAVRSIAEIHIQEAGAQDVVHLRDGRTLKGSVTFPEDLRLQMGNGTIQNISKLEMRQVLVAPAPPQAPPPATGPKQTDGRNRI